MITMLSLVTSVKDYIEIAHKLIETQNTNYFVGTSSTASNLTESFFGIRDYNEFGAILTYSVLSIKEFLINFFTFAWLNNIWSLPLIVPDITSAMISEISVLDSYFTNAFSFLDNGVSSTLSTTAYGSNQNTFLFGFEKFMIGLFNSFFLFLPTSTAHLITVRRFVMQGIEAGFIAGLGTIAGNFFWLASIILGLRFFVIPWLSLDIFRYVLGFMLLVKYLWDSSKELNKSKTNLEESTKKQIFLLNFLLALTEQTSIYPFISNISFGAEGSIIEGFSGTIFQSENFLQFFGIHSCYLLGILLGSFSLLQFTVWFWENPAFSIYMWMISSYRVTTSSYYKVLNFIFLYLTMLCAISSIPYFGLDYTISNPLGLIPQDRMIDQKKATANGPGENILPEASFLSVKPTDKNTRIRDGIHARRERWKDRLIKYQAFDASLYEQGVYDILTVEDLNYGFDRFWLRRKMRNHQIRFRLFPGPWMRSLKKQLNKPGFSGPRLEFFRMLFEQYYHPSFHSSALPNKKSYNNSLKANVPVNLSSSSAPLMLYEKGIDSRLDNNSGVLTSTKTSITNQEKVNLLRKKNIYNFKTKKGLISEYSALRKFSRNVTTRLNVSSLGSLSSPSASKNFKNAVLNNGIAGENSSSSKLIYSKSLKSLFTQINKDYTKSNLSTFRTISKTLLLPKLGNNALENLNYNNINSNSFANINLPTWGQQKPKGQRGPSLAGSLKNTSIRKKLSKKERFLLLAKSNYTQNIANSLGISGKKAESNSINYTMDIPLQPLNFYIQKNEAFKRKLKYYSTATTRTFSVGNNAPYFKTILKRAFYYHKPSLRWKRTMFTAAMRRGFRKKSVNPKKIQYNTNNLTTSLVGPLNSPNKSASPEVSEKEAQAFLMQPSQQYSVLGKRASRYRYQIYKDVLQHWYYTPFNRLLLKYDIDSFMNRQPKTHFLTKNEEKLLHLRRILLSEHYNTLRWYTYMQHYRTMKARIGGTKSFASTAYNQQFQGSFKKIRHLFAITPIQARSSSNSQDMSLLQGKNLTSQSVLQNNYGGVWAEGPDILKFDQPLYNENNKQISSGPTAYSSESAQRLKEKSAANITPQGELPSGPNLKLSKSKKVSVILSSPYKHEDLTKSAPTNSIGLVRVPGEIGTQPKDLIDESLKLTGAMIQMEQSKKQVLIKEYINQKNYTALTNLLNNNYNIMNPVDATPNQTKEAFVSRPTVKGQPVLFEGNGQELNTKLVLLDLLKQCKNQLNDQMFLKNYISHRIEKREQRNKQNSNEIKAQLENLKNWLSPIKVLTSSAIPTKISKEQLGSEKNPLTIPQPTTGISKAVNDGVFVLNKINPAIQQKSFMTKKINSLKFSKDFIQNPYRSRTNGNKPISYYINQTYTEQITQTLNAIKGVTLLIKQYTSELREPQTLQSQGTLKPSTKSTFLRKNKQMILKRRVNDIKSLLNQILKPYFVLQNAILSKRVDKNLEWWRQKQRVMSKRKASRKKARFKTIKASFDKPTTGSSIEMNSILNSNISPSSPNDPLIRDNLQSMDTWNPKLNRLRKKTDNSELPQANALRSLKQKFSQKFRKKAKGRRYKNLSMNRGFAYVRKPKNVNGFANIPSFLESFDSYGFKFKDNLFSEAPNGENNLKMVISKDDKVNLLKDFKKKLSQTILQSTDSSASWSQQFIKNAPAKKRSKRTWKRRKRQKFARNHLKYRKRNIHGFGKIRVLAKKLKRIKNSLEFQNWWWNSYLPNFVGSGDLVPRQYSGTISNSLNSSQARNKTMVNDISFKPLSTRQALEIQSKQQMLTKDTETPNNSLVLREQNIENLSLTNLPQKSNTNILDDIYDNFLTGSGAEGLTAKIASNQQRLDPLNPLRPQNQNLSKYNLTTNLPFYAGWDESLRKFVVTNRFLSRRETGSIVDLNGIFGGTNSNLQKVQKDETPLINNEGSANLLEFSKAPIKGLNEGSFLYLQTDMPFNSYTIDQFIPNNQSFYAPLGWKRFQFRHSQLKNWLTNHSSRLRTKESTHLTALSNLGGQKIIPQQQSLRLKNRSNLEFFGLMDTTNNLGYGGFGPQNDYSFGQKAILTNKRIKKRYKLLKQTPMQLMYVPTGSLLTETLPSHYISVFDKQYRFPRNRFLKRSLLKDKQKGYSNLKDLTILEASTTGYKSKEMVSDFTLRKRVKPRRKYHKKRFVQKEGLIFPRRRMFTNSLDSTDNIMYTGTETYLRLRPSTKVTTKQSTLAGKAKGTAPKKRGPKTNPIRLRQLRRREFSQIIKPLQRFQPRYGGFTWPGDYLKLEIIPMPKLKPTTFVSTYGAESSIVPNLSLQSDMVSNSGALKGSSLALKPTSANTSVSQTLSNGGSLDEQSMASDNSGLSQSKRKISVQPIGILPRKYLLQKHNLKIFKKKLSLKYGK